MWFPIVKLCIIGSLYCSTAVIPDDLKRFESEERCYEVITSWKNSQTDELKRKKLRFVFACVTS